MELLFLGTFTGVPTRSRNVTTILLNLQHPAQAGLWLFDCSGGTQHQVLTTPSNPGKLDHIFISHLHGGHLSGLPGLPCSRSMAGNVQPLTLYGPKGLREFTETTLCPDGSWTGYPLDIVKITPDEIMDDGLRKVTAYPLTHSLKCYDFHIQEYDKPDTLNTNALKATGVKAGPWFQDLKAGKTIMLKDGRTIHGTGLPTPATRGKSAAIFGDTESCTSAIELARSVDVMVHRTTPDASMEEKVNNRGHSSTRQATQLTLDAGVRRLIMTHVSPRYDEKGCRRLLAECKTVFSDTELAHDLAVFTV